MCAYIHMYSLAAFLTNNYYSAENIYDIISHTTGLEQRKTNAWE